MIAGSSAQSQFPILVASEFAALQPAQVALVWVHKRI